MAVDIDVNFNGQTIGLAIVVVLLSIVLGDYLRMLNLRRTLPPGPFRPSSFNSAQSQIN